MGPCAMCQAAQRPAQRGEGLRGGVLGLVPLGAHKDEGDACRGGRWVGTKGTHNVMYMLHLFVILIQYMQYLSPKIIVYST